MEEKVKKAIEEYQCAGCMKGCDTSCHKPDETEGIGCGAHHAATIMLGAGKLFLGLPKGFNRLGWLGALSGNDFRPKIFEKFTKEDKYDAFNVAVWKHLDEHGHTIVRGLRPRKNEPFLHIYLENCMDKIKCHEITKEETEKMD